MDVEIIESNFDDSLLMVGEGEIVRPIQTMPLQEFRLLDFCRDAGVVCYLPLKKVWKVSKQVHGGKTYSYPKQVAKPMFTSYVFAKLNQEQRSQVYQSRAVARILSIDSAMESRFYDEIRTVRKLELIGLNQELDFNAEIKEGEKFLIESGVWQGVYGWLKKKEKRFLWTVEIESIGSLVRATIDPSKYKMSRVED